MAQSLEEHGIRTSEDIHWNLTTPRLYEAIVRKEEALLAHGGPVVITTTPHTGRSPNDKFIIDDSVSHDAVWWGPVNQPLAEGFHGELTPGSLECLGEGEVVGQEVLRDPCRGGGTGS